MRIAEEGLVIVIYHVGQWRRILDNFVKRDAFRIIRVLHFFLVDLDEFDVEVSHMHVKCDLGRELEWVVEVEN